MTAKTEGNSLAIANVARIARDGATIELTDGARKAGAGGAAYLANSVTWAVVFSECRSARLVHPHYNGGLPAFLIHPESARGENSRFMIARYTAASSSGDARRMMTRPAPAARDRTAVRAHRKKTPPGMMYETESNQQQRGTQ